VADQLSKINPQQMVIITYEKVAFTVKKLRDAGPDSIQNFWIKYLTSLHHRLASQFQNMLDGGEIPEWFPHDRTVLIMKKKDIGPSLVSNYPPIKCLSNVWKLLASILANEILAHVEENNS